MRPSAIRLRLVLSLVFGLGSLGLTALLFQTNFPVRAQDEKTRLTGRNFSDAQSHDPDEAAQQKSWADQSGLIAAPSQSTTTLSVDDGTNEAAVGISGGGTPTGVNRLTPTSYPATLTGVSIFFQSQQGLPLASPITVLVGTNPSGAANINNITFSQQISAAVETTGSFWVYTVAPVTINSGDFVVGFRATHAAGQLPLAIDRNPPMQRRSYISTSGTTFTILDDAIPSVAGNLMIRARVQSQPPSCHAVSGVNPASGAIGSQVTITGSNFTGVNAVRFANNVNASFTVNSATQITATVPSGAVTGPITISKPNCPNVTTAAFTVPGGCTYSINPTSKSFAAGGGTDTVAVTTQAGCAWTAMSNATWITITAGASGNGSGSVSYSVASNAGNPPRTGTMTIAGRTFTVDQSGCAYTLSASSQTFSSSGGNGGVNVTAASGCAWTATSDAPWITINSGASGNGNGAVNYSVAANTGPPRIGTMTIAGRTFTVAQGSDQPTHYRGAWQGMTDQNLPIRFTVDNNDIVVNLEADVRISFFVPPNSQATCTYKLRGDAPAIINNGQFEVTLVSVDNAVAFQTSAQPSVRGTLSSATSASGQITSSTAGFIICGGTLTLGSISVSSKTWNAQKQSQPGCHSVTGVNPPSGQAGAQVTITGSNFTGVNAVRFANNVSSNFTVNSATQITATVPNGAASGPITISKPNCPDVTTAAFTVNRVCAFAIAPTSQFFLSGGGNGGVNVMTETGCAWMAVSNAPWITITGGANGSGAGKVDYSVAADASGAMRSGTMTIAGQTFTVRQGFSTAGGWSRQTSGVTQELRSVHFVGESEGWAAGANATLLRTTDGGNTWSMVNTGADPARGFNTVRFVNRNTGWVGGASTLAHTQNAGANWAVAPLPSTVLVANNVTHHSFHPLSTTSVWACGEGTLSSSPAGTLSLYSISPSGMISSSGNIVNSSSGPAGFRWFDLHFLDSSNGWAIGGNGAIERVALSDPVPFRGEPSGTSQRLNAIYMLGFAAGWIVGDSGVILKYAGGGVWMAQTSGTTANLRDVHFLDVNRGWVVGDGGVILTTADGGVTWTQEPSGVTDDLRGVFFPNAGVGFAVGANGTILKRTPPAGSFASVSAASFVDIGAAPESIAAGFGQGLASRTELAASLPLPTTLAGTSVVVRDSASAFGDGAAVDRLAPLFFVSANQINFQFPPGTALGAANVSVLRGGAVVASGTVQINSVAPGLFAASSTGQGAAAAVVFRRRADGSESFEPVAQFDQAQNRFVTIPIDLGTETDQVFLIPFGSGFRLGAAATATIGGVNSEVVFAGATPGFAGLDQANVRLSRNLIGRGEVDVLLTVDGKTSNAVKVNIK